MPNPCEDFRHCILSGRVEYGLDGVNQNRFWGSTEHFSVAELNRITESKNGISTFVHGGVG